MKPSALELREARKHANYTKASSSFSRCYLYLLELLERLEEIAVSPHGLPDDQVEDILDAIGRVLRGEDK